MYIQSLTLHLNDEQIRQTEVITNKRALRAALSEILQDVEVDLSDIGEQGLVLPLLITEAKVSHSEIKFRYDVINAESGLLSLVYQDNKGKLRKKEFDQVSRHEFEHHIEQMLAFDKNAFIEQYFPPKGLLEKVADVMAITMLLCGILGLFSLFFFSNLIWHDEVMEQIWPIAGMVYLVSGVMLLPKILSNSTRERAKMMGQSLTRQMFGLVVGNLVLTCFVMLGGSRIWHYLHAKPAQVEIVFADKASYYYSKNCKGSVRLEKFSGSICLKNKAYWQVIESGSQATAIGQLSLVAFDIEAIELK
ncbi:hypothetical protein K6689_004253 [Vibrio parahaemolyticus]|nr:hypothetical protein [Vibrio parahaemolyticus]